MTVITTEEFIQEIEAGKAYKAFAQPSMTGSVAIWDGEYLHVPSGAYLSIIDPDTTDAAIRSLTIYRGKQGVDFVFT